MAIPDLLKERKYPFIFSLFTLLIFVTFLLITNTQSPLSSTSTSSLLDPSLSTPPSSSESDPSPSTLALSNSTSTVKEWNWKACKGDTVPVVDYIPCLDNTKAIKALISRRHMEHRERHCPTDGLRCLVPLPPSYKVPVPWPKSRDMIWFDNVPHPKLVEYKKEQNWVRKSGDYFVFPGGGTQFKDGVAHYIDYIERTLPTIEWGKRTRVILDVGCGVASFGGYLLDKDVITMSFAPKDEHEAQIQFALERGIPATLSVIGTQRLTFPDNVYDLIHCARCRVHWDADGGKPIMELNRILRPGGYFIWSATPVYRKDERDQNVWNGLYSTCLKKIAPSPTRLLEWITCSRVLFHAAMVALTEAICWKVVAKNVDSSGIGLVIYEKPVSSSCYELRKENNPPLCDESSRPNSSWYVPLDGCIPPIPLTSEGGSYRWPTPWPQRLKTKPIHLSTEPDAEEIFTEDTRHWSALVYDVYLGGLAINWSNVRNVMDMNAGYGGFAASLIDQPLWVMNVVPVSGQDTLPLIFDRGLIGIYHDWCESLNTYPRTYDLLHASFLFGNLTQRCDTVDVAVEIDRVLRPNGVLLVQDTLEMINKLSPILHTLHWSITIHREQFLVGKKGFWRPN